VMSAWRRRAIDQFPRLKPGIEKCEGIRVFWIDLWVDFESAHEAPMDEVFIEKVYDYARWCFYYAHNPKITFAVARHFYGYLPTEPLIRREVPKWLKPGDFEGFREVFRYQIGDDDLERFSREYYEAGNQKGMREERFKLEFGRVIGSKR
jgi:hypothetical protein